jgi:hypothetical protein
MAGLGHECPDGGSHAWVRDKDGNLFCMKCHGGK